MAYLYELILLLKHQLQIRWFRFGRNGRRPGNASGQASGRLVAMFNPGFLPPSSSCCGCSGGPAPVLQRGLPSERGCAMSTRLLAALLLALAALGQAASAQVWLPDAWHGFRGSPAAELQALASPAPCRRFSRCSRCRWEARSRVQNPIPLPARCVAAGTVSASCCMGQCHHLCGDLGSMLAVANLQARCTQ